MIKFDIEIPKDVTMTKQRIRNARSILYYNVRPDLRGLMNETTFGWSAKNKPRWDIQYGVTADEIYVKISPIGPGGEIWKLVSLGARPHVINPRGPWLLRFRPGYRAATTPGSLRSQRAYRSGPEIRMSSIPRHPGFTGRNFPDLIVEAYEGTFYAEMLGAFDL